MNPLPSRPVPTQGSSTFSLSVDSPHPPFFFPLASRFDVAPGLNEISGWHQCKIAVNILYEIREATTGSVVYETRGGNNFICLFFFFRSSKEMR